MEVTSDEELAWPKRQIFRKSMKKIKAQATEILNGIPQMNVLLEQNAIVEAKLEKRSQELELQEKELQSKRLDLEKICQIFQQEKAEAGDLKKTVEECKEELRSTRKQLTVKIETSKMIQGEIESKSKQLAVLKRRCSEALTIEVETDKKKKELLLILDQIKESDKQLELKNTRLRVVMAEIARRCCEVEERKREMEEVTDKKEKQLLLILDLITESGKQLELKETWLREVTAVIARRSLEATQVEDRMKEMEEETVKMKTELALLLKKIKESGKQLVTVDEQLESRGRLLEMRSLELVSKEEELESVRESNKLCNSDLELKEKKVESLNNWITVCGKEIDSKSNELGEIQKLIKHHTIELGDMQNQRDSVKLMIEELSQELVAKRKEHEEILETICRSSSEMEEWVKEIQAAKTEAIDLNLRSERFRQEVEGKEKELNLLKNQIELEEKKLVQLKIEMQEEADRKRKDLVLIISKVEESDKKLAAVKELVESQQRRLEMQSMELISKDMELERVAESSKCFEFDIAVKEKRVQALNELITISGEEVDLKSKELEDIQKLIKKQTSELGVMHDRRDSTKRLIQELAEKIDAKEKRHKEILEDICKSSSEMESIKTVASEWNEKSQSFRRDVEDREKELAQLRNQIKSEEYELTRLKKSIQDCRTELSSRRDQVEAIKKIQREFQSKKQLRPTSSVLVRHEQQPTSTYDTSQQNATETDADIEDVIMDHEMSTILNRNDVSIVLQGSPNPAELVLELVQNGIREEVDIHDSLVKNWILLFEELAEIQRSNDAQVQLKAKQVATLWKRKIAIEAPKSPLEALAFLQFISAYGLKELINEEETALLASSIAQYEQAPGIFVSLSLNPKIREFVRGCIEKSQYIPAVRLICLFKLNTVPSPSELLMKEITNLTQTRRTESSQDKDKDAGKLRAILELVAAYKLEIYLPGDLVADLMVQGENSTPPVAQCPVKHLSANLHFPKLEAKPYLVNPSGNGRS